MTIYLTKDELLDIHEKVQKKYKTDVGILNKGHIQVILDTPSHNFYGKEIFQTIYEKAAAYLVNISRLHAFVDGNKRTALLATETFLQSNGIELILPLKATRISVDLGKTEDTTESQILINECSKFLNIHALDSSDLRGSLQNMNWMLNEISEFLKMPEHLKTSLLKYWLVFEVYPEYEEKSSELINEYVSNLYTTLTLFINKMEYPDYP